MLAALGIVVTEKPPFKRMMNHLNILRHKYILIVPKSQNYFQHAKFFYTQFWTFCPEVQAHPTSGQLDPMLSELNLYPSRAIIASNYPFRKYSL